MTRSQAGWCAVVACVLLGGLPAPAAHAEAPPEESYRLHCSGCHGADGSGDGGIVPTLRELDRLLVVAGGRRYLGSVPGVAQAPLDDAALAALLNWVLRELSGASGFATYSADEVGALRAHPLRDPAAQRPQVDASRGS